MRLSNPRDLNEDRSEERNLSGLSACPLSMTVDAHLERGFTVPWYESALIAVWLILPFTFSAFSVSLLLHTGSHTYTRQRTPTPESSVTLTRATARGMAPYQIRRVDSPSHTILEQEHIIDAHQSTCHTCAKSHLSLSGSPPPPSNSGCHRLLTSSSPYSAAIGGATSVMSSPPAGLRCCIWRCACGGGGGGACAGTGSGRGVSVTGPRGTPMRGSGCGNGARREVVMAQRAF